MTLTPQAARRMMEAAAVAAASLFAVAAAQAQTEPDGKWHGAISLGGAFATGNTDTLSVTLAADATKVRPIDRVSLSGLVNYGKSTINGVDTTTADQAWIRGRYDYNLTEVVFVFGGAAAQTHKAAGTRSRYDLNAGVGYKLIRNPTTSFDVFAGVGYSGVEFTDDSSANGGQLVLGEESSHKIAESSTFNQRFTYRPGQSDLGDLATFTAGWATAITGAWTINVGLAAQWASVVPAGSKSTDALLTVGFGYKF